MQHRNTARRRKSRNALARAAHAASCEALEHRVLRAGDPSVSTLTIVGTDGPDVISVSVSDHYAGGKHVQWDINGKVHVEISHFFKTVVVHGKNGDDKIKLWQGFDDTAVQLHGDGGNDTLTFGDYHLKGYYTAVGGSGTDKCVVDQNVGSGEQVNNEYSVDNNGVEFSWTNNGMNRVNTLADVEELELQTSTGKDRIWIEGNPSHRKTTVTAGTGDDTTILLSTSSSIKGELRLNGNGGDDTVKFYDFGDGGNYEYRLLANMLDVPGVLEHYIAYSAERVQLEASQGNNTIKLISSLSKSVSLYGGAGHDVFEVGDGDLDSLLAKTAVSVDGDGYQYAEPHEVDTFTDRLVLRDKLDASERTYEYNAYSVWRSGTANFVSIDEDLNRLDIQAGAAKTMIRPGTVNDAKYAFAGTLWADAGGGNDSVTGTGKNDTLLGGVGHDTLDGAGGNDSLVGGDGGAYDADKYVGGSGSDTVSYETRSTGLTIDLNTPGGDGAAGENDAIGDDVETIRTGTGWDTITLKPTAAGGGRAVYAGFGNDVINGSSAGDTLDGGAGVDSLVGNGGNDIVHVRGSAGSVAKGGDGNDQIFIWSAAGVKIEGNGGNDFLNGGAGNDTMLGGSGNDQAFGGGGNDSIKGESGYDHLEGNAGNDTLDGGSEKDTLYGHAGADLLLGGSGDDKLYANDGYGVDRVDGGYGVDEIFKDPYDTLLGS